MDYLKLREEPLKSAVREDYFGSYKYTQIGNIDFVIAKRYTELIDDLRAKQKALAKKIEANVYKYGFLK